MTGIPPTLSRFKIPRTGDDNMRNVIAILFLAACGNDGKTPVVNVDVFPADPVVVTNIITETVTNTETNTVTETVIVTVPAVDADGDLFPAELDCDDSNPDINPGADEICDAVDNDCDSLMDSGDDNIIDAETFYQDLDLDGHGSDSATPQAGCTPLPGYALVPQDDCDDNSPDISPDSSEVAYNGIDEDCDGEIDNCGSFERRLHDLDGDGYGDPNNYEFVDICNAWLPGLTGWQVGMDDCDDLNPTAYPGAPEVCGDDVDNDCNGQSDVELELGWLFNETFCNNLTITSTIAQDSLMQTEISGEQYLYYMDSSLNRHFISSDAVLESWYGVDSCTVCEQVTLLDSANVAQYVLDENITVKPGTFIVKLTAFEAFYVVDSCATVRETEPAVLQELYGNLWPELIRTISDFTFDDYVMGSPVLNATDYDLAAAQARTLEEEVDCQSTMEIIFNGPMAGDLIPDGSVDILDFNAQVYGDPQAEIDELHYTLTGDLGLADAVYIGYVDATYTYVETMGVPDANGDVWFLNASALINNSFHVRLWVDVNPSAQPGETIQATLVTSDLLVTGWSSGNIFDPATDITPSSDIVGYVQTVQ